MPPTVLQAIWTGQNVGLWSHVKRPIHLNFAQIFAAMKFNDAYESSIYTLFHNAWLTTREFPQQKSGSQRAGPDGKHVSAEAGLSCDSHAAPWHRKTHGSDLAESAWESCHTWFRMVNDA